MQLYMPTRVYSEENCVLAHAAELRAQGKKAMIVTGRHSAKATGALQDVVQALGETPYVIFDRIEENPSVETVMEARAAAIAEAERLGIDDRVHATDASAPRPALLGLLDILALPDAGAEASPMLFVEAMAAGLPVVAPRAGEGRAVLASENGPLLMADAAPERTAEPVSTLAGALAEMLGRLAGDEVMRRRIGEANRAKARQEHDAARMVERIRALYWNLMGRQ